MKLESAFSLYILTYLEELQMIYLDLILRTNSRSIGLLAMLIINSECTSVLSIITPFFKAYLGIEYNTSLASWKLWDKLMILLFSSVINGEILISGWK